MAMDFGATQTRGAATWLATMLLALAACSSTTISTTRQSSTRPPSLPAAAMEDPELGARFPESVGGEPFPVETYQDENVLRAMGVDDHFLDTLNADLADVSLALGHRPMATDTSTHLSAYAYRVNGASEGDLVDYFVPIIEGQTEDATFKRETVGTREVWKPIGPGQAVAGNLLYVDGDTAYLLYGNEPDVVALLLEALP